MARTGVLEHNPDLSGQVTGWRSLAENVGYGGDEQSVHRALMNSSGHRANILDPRFTQIGIGVAWSGGRVWVTQVFREPVQSSYAALVGGAIGARYESLGGPRSVLGMPVTPELATPHRYGRYNHFQSGSIYWSPATGAWETHGAIRSRWASMGWENSFLGFPRSNEEPLVRGGAFNRFEGGQIYWSPATGAREVHGAIFAAWGRHGWERGPLGYPLTDEVPTPRRVGAFNHFEGGSVYWSPSTGAYAVWGLIREAWAGVGWENSCLGFPTSDEYDVMTPNGPGKRSTFERGQITWTPATGAVVSCR